MTALSCFCLLVLFFSPVWAEDLSGEEILKRIDDNFLSSGSISVSTMIITGRRGTRTITSRQWAQGTRKTFTHFLSPPREKGTKMLKIEDALWIYTPATDRLIKIAGHMLRQSLMGSDASYEDFMEDPELNKTYDVNISGTETYLDRACYVLELTAKPGSKVAYHSRKFWVDKERFLALREDLFAKSGKLLKKVTIQEVFRVDGRWYPKRFTFKDVLKDGDGTQIIIDNIELDAEIPEYMFSKAALRR
ncbi:MAG: outer membrane lipoprotein-sorting protein [Desulfobacteraceae bacterium]|nr:outer membrane lipoprotein-sorting protein [Desulfobacteraceae bacterium]